MFAYEEEIAYNCFISVIGDYKEYHSSDYLFTPNKNKRPISGGAGWIFAGFVVGEQNSEKMYQEMKAIYPIVYESEIRKNINTRNQVFFVIFDYAAVTDNYGFTQQREFDEEL